jgi:hypothetical protein
MDEQFFRLFLGSHPDYAGNLDGFVHYDNMLASGGRTIIAMPCIMTGVPYTRDMLYSAYIESIWTDDTPFAAMRKAGWDVSCYTYPMFFGQKATEYVHNLAISKQKVGSYAMLGEKLYKLTAFRFAPHLMKRLFWMDTAEFNEAIDQTTDTGKRPYVQNDAHFYRNFLTNGGYSVSSDYEKAFRLYLLNGAHVPYKLSSDGLDNSKATSLEEQVEGNFALLKAILQDLRDKGLYDSSTIIVSADHGQNNYQQHPMFLYKAAGARGELTVSHVPASMFDLYTLFYATAGKTAPENQYTMDFLTLGEGDVRERHYFRNATNSARDVVIKEFVTTDLAEEADKMLLVHEYLGEGKDVPYQLGEKLSFAADATANRYCVDGFGTPVGWYTPVLGPYARMEIPIKKLPKTGQIEVQITLGTKVTTETNVRIFANGKPVLEEEITANTLESGLNFTMDIDSVFENGNNLLDLEFYFDGVSMDEMSLPRLKRTETIRFVEMFIRQVR